jgi:hypothetical protein
VDDVSNLARTSRAMYKTLGQSAVKMSKLKRAVDLALSVQVNRLNELTPQQRAQISDAIADPRPIPLHREAEILAPLNREIERHGNSLGLRSFDEMSASAIAEIVNWPQAFQETGREAVAQKILEENRGCDALRPLLALDSSVAAHIVPQLLYWLDNGRPQNPQDQHPDLRAAPQLQGPNIGTPDAPRFIQHDDPRPPMPTFGLVAAWVFQTFMQPNPQQPRPDHFQSIALRGAISGIAECSGLRSHPDVLNGQDFRTAMFDEVKSHADRLPEKYRNQVLAHLDAQVAAIRSREGL